MKTGLSKFQSRVTVTSKDDGAPKYSPTCEIPGCMTEWIVPLDPKSAPFHAPGRTVTLVYDFRGDKRAICGEHYVRGLVKAGRHPNQDIMNPDGSVSIPLVHERWARIDEEKGKIEAAATLMRERMLENDSH